MEIVFENPYGRTLAGDYGEVDEVYCAACAGWCRPETCSCKECRAAWNEYRESLRTDESV